MTRVQVRKNKRKQRVQYHVTVSGHAGYAQAGHDPVCAAISTVTNLLYQTVVYMPGGQVLSAETGVPGQVDLVFSVPSMGERTVQAVIRGYDMIAKEYPEYCVVADPGCQAVRG